MNWFQSSKLAVKFLNFINVVEKYKFIKSNLPYVSYSLLSCEAVMSLFILCLNILILLFSVLKWVIINYQQKKLI